MGFVVNYPPATSVTVDETTNAVTVAAAGPRGPQGEPGLVAATAPLTYDSDTQTVGIDESGIAITIQQVSGVTFGTASPTGGVDGDIFLQYTP